MKKFLFLVVLSVFMAAGCSDSNDDNGGNYVTTPEISDIATLHGTYDIEFAYVDAQAAVLTTDCSKIAEYVGENARKCTVPGTDGVDYKGEATITVNEDNSIKVMSKLQMSGGVFETNTIVMNAAADRVYSFTEFPTVPSNAISETTINDSETGNAVKGTYSRSATILVDETKSVNNTFYFTVEEDGTVVNRLVDYTVMPADTVVRMKKRSDEVINLDPNTPYESPKINNFDSNVKYILKNN